MTYSTLRRMRRGVRAIHTFLHAALPSTSHPRTIEPAARNMNQRRGDELRQPSTAVDLIGF